jgi:hypothetical protein
MDIADALKRGILEAVEGRSKKFLADHPDAQAFLVDRAKRVGELGEEYVLAGNDIARAKVIEQLEVVEQSVANELSHVAVDASVEARGLFGDVLTASLQVLKAVLPVLVAAI